MMKNETNAFNIVLLEDVSTVDRHGMNFMTKGTKGTLLYKGEVVSTIRVQGQIYYLPNISFLELSENIFDMNVA